MFDANKWQEKIFEVRSGYSFLFKLACKPESVQPILDNVASSLARDDSEVDVKVKLYKVLAKKNEGNIEKGIQHYSSMLVVTFGSYVEAMTAECFEQLFLSKPLAMYDFIHPEDSSSERKGKVDLNLIVKAKNKDDIIEKLVSIATKNAANGSMKTIGKRIERITKYNPDSDVIRVAEKYMKIRHQVVHELHTITNGSDDVATRSFELLFHYLVELVNAMKHLGVPCELPEHWPGYPFAAWASTLDVIEETINQYS